MVDRFARVLDKANELNALLHGVNNGDSTAALAVVLLSICKDPRAPSPPPIVSVFAEAANAYIRDWSIATRADDDDLPEGLPS